MQNDPAYIKMAAAAANAIDAIDAANYGYAREILVKAMQVCEEMWIGEDSH